MSLTDVYEELTGELTVGKLLHAYRTTNSLTIPQMEKKMGLTKGELLRVEGGRKKLTLKEAIKYAHKLREAEDFYAEIWFREEARAAGLDPDKFLKVIE
jgi:transcriptional regulator with XRE-family HTH domain